MIGRKCHLGLNDGDLCVADVVLGWGETSDDEGNAENAKCKMRKRSVELSYKPEVYSKSGKSLPHGSSVNWPYDDVVPSSGYISNLSDPSKSESVPNLQH
jgi:hypothetical protein